MDSIYNEIIAFDDGYLLVRPSQSRIAKLVHGEINTERTVLHLWATAETGTLISLVENFNLSNPRYTIVVDTEYDLGPEAVRAEIMAGNGPDIYALVETLEFAEINSKFIFEDIYPYLDKSQTFSTKDFVPEVIKALELDGSLYVLPLDFSIWTLVKRTDLLADGELSDALNLPQVEDGSITIFPQSISQNDMFYWLSNMYLNNHMNNGRCDFNTEEYLAILNACASIDAHEINELPSIYSVENIARLLRLIYLQDAYDDEYTFQSGLGSCLFASQSLAIANTSANKDGAWEFIEYALSADIEQTSDAAFPVLISKLNALLESGSTTGVWRYKTNQFEKLTSHSEKEITTLIETTHCALDQYSSLIEIMKEEAVKFFCGDRNIEETVQITQSRANIYALIHDPSLIKEQKTAPEVTESFGLQQEFDDLLLVQPIDEVKAKRLIFQMASVQYSAIDNSEYETTRLQRSISKREPQTELDADLLAKVVDKVIVNRISTQVILKNGQIINSEEVL